MQWLSDLVFQCIGLETFLTFSTNMSPKVMILSEQFSNFFHVLEGQILYNGMLYIRTWRFWKKPDRFSMKDRAFCVGWFPRQPILSSNRNVPIAEMNTQIMEEDKMYLVKSYSIIESVKVF